MNCYVAVPVLLALRGGSCKPLTLLGSKTLSSVYRIRTLLVDCGIWFFKPHGRNILNQAEPLFWTQICHTWLNFFKNGFCIKHMSAFHLVRYSTVTLQSIVAKLFRPILRFETKHLLSVAQIPIPPPVLG